MFTVSDTEFIVDDDKNPWPYPDKDGKHYTWSEIKDKALILPFDSMAAISSYILKQCNDNQTCKSEAVPKFKAKILRFNQIINMKGSP